MTQNLYAIARGFEERDRERVVALLREYETGGGISLCFQDFAAEVGGLARRLRCARGGNDPGAPACSGGAVGCVAVRQVAARPGCAR